MSGAQPEASVSRAPARIEARIGHVFANRALLEEALTHVSAGEGRLSYQRLEFLGDRVLGLVVATMLFEAFPEAPEGELSRRLAALVRKETCAAIAREWRLDEEIRVGEGERRSGARRRDALLGDACEALIGAVYRDGGIEAAARLVRAHWTARMQAPQAVPRDAKTMLQEAVQARGLPVPAYRDIGRKGPDHAPEFEIAVLVEGSAEAIGRGASKRLAERAAAEAWLRRAGLWTEET
ncbi:ribonuclease III [Rhabdaerophilum calidifontis]|uniref:ribonuclease III n=1 Tax=Rhabdaerophilum calidifontis TaxID=2604328 RepID=UPI001238F321|nr:ribonuclease III [Rhabdaerophilum calidifontis]